MKEGHRQTRYILMPYLLWSHFTLSGNHSLILETQYHIYVHLASEQEHLILRPSALDWEKAWIYQLAGRYWAPIFWVRGPWFFLSVWWGKGWSTYSFQTRRLEFFRGIYKVLKMFNFNIFLIKNIPLFKIYEKNKMYTKSFPQGILLYRHNWPVLSR